MAIQSESYESIFEQYSAAIWWMEQLGIKLTPGRTSYYEKVVRHWKDAYRTASAEQGREIFPDFVSSMFEIFDFVSIHKAFCSVLREDLASIIEKLKRGVNGPINAADETPKSTTARNFLFEVTVAAKAHRPDQRVEAILDAKSDTGIRMNDERMWVECKRVTTVERIESNVREASSQLENLLYHHVDSGDRGIVAMDVSKILNRGDQIYVARDDDQLMASVDGIMERFIEQHSHIWEQVYKRRHKKIIGTIIRFAFMASSEARNLLVHAQQWAMNPRVGISATDEQLLKKLVATLASGKE